MFQAGYSNGTLPTDICATVQRPDIVTVDRNTMEINLIELTVPFETNIEVAHSKKELRYTNLKDELIEQGYKTTLTCYEIGALGHVTTKNKTDINRLLKNLKVTAKYKKLITQMSKTALLGSFSIYRSTTQPSWDNPDLLSEFPVKSHPTSSSPN